MWILMNKTENGVLYTVSESKWIENIVPVTERVKLLVKYFLPSKKTLRMWQQNMLLSVLINRRYDTNVTTEYATQSTHIMPFI